MNLLEISKYASTDKFEIISNWKSMENFFVIVFLVDVNFHYHQKTLFRCRFRVR